MLDFARSMEDVATAVRDARCNLAADKSTLAGIRRRMGRRDLSAADLGQLQAEQLKWEREVQRWDRVAMEEAPALLRIDFAGVWRELRQMWRLRWLSWSEREQLGAWLDEGFYVEDGRNEVKRLLRLRVDYLFELLPRPRPGSNGRKEAA